MRGETYLQRVLESKRRQTDGTERPVVDRLLDTLAPLQLRFVTDRHRYKVVRAGRRGGKTYADAVYFLRTMLQYPGTPNLYLSLTRESGKEAVWDTLLELMDRYRISHKVWESTMRIVIQNGSRFRGVGADSRSAKERIRGAKHKLSIVDECGFVKHVDDLVPIIIPTLADYAGTFAMTSSPPPVLKGLFYEADRGRRKSAYTQYHWNIRDNPHFMVPAEDPKYPNRAEEELASVVESQFGGDLMDPVFRREYLGLWVGDNHSRVFPITDSKNVCVIGDLPSGLEFVVSLNISRFPKVAVTVMAFTEGAPVSYVVEASVKDFKRASRFVDYLEKLDKIYPEALIIMACGEHRSAPKELSKRGLPTPMIAVDKDTPMLRELASSDIQESRVKLVEGYTQQLKDSMLSTMKENDEIVADQDTYLTDSFVHGHRFIYQAVIEGYEPPKTEEDLMEDYLDERFRKESDEAESEY